MLLEIPATNVYRQNYKISKSIFHKYNKLLISNSSSKTRKPVNYFAKLINATTVPLGTCKRLAILVNFTSCQYKHQLVLTVNYQHQLQHQLMLCMYYRVNNTYLAFQL